MQTTPLFRAIASRFTYRTLLVGCAVLAVVLMNRGSSQPLVHASSTTISNENTKAGAVDWDITGAGDPDIQGFATDISVNVGETVHFKIAAPGASGYQLIIYRLGFYGGAGATQVAVVGPSASLPQTQPACVSQMGTTGLRDCGNWAESASWTVPATAVSGIYIAKPTRPDNGHASHIVFVVRDDSRTADIVFQTSDTTWQAYNQYPGVTNGGASLYCGGPLSNVGSSYLQSCATRAAKVSYNRPFDTRAHDPQSFLFNAEYPMVRWLEANGYDVKYQSGVDTDRRNFDLIGAHKPKVFLSVGHDEYWSGAQRQAVENARNVGVNLAFVSGNEMYWKTRYEPSIDGSGTAYRTLVTYKETIANAKIDPAVDPITNVPIWTGTWRDPRFAATSDGGQPENGLIGQIFTVNCCSDRIKIPRSMGSLRLWANTGVSAVPAGDVYRTPEETLGYEWDEDLDNGSRPAGLVHLSSTTLDVAEKLSDFGANVAPGRATHAMTLYRHSSGALVFGAGTVQWSWGLDGNHDRGTTPTSHNADQAMQQATVNLLADMDVQPATLQIGADPTRPLVAATRSADTFGPSSSIVFPLPGESVASGSRLTVNGTSTDQGGGQVAGVEVSVDGGTTWKAAQGTTQWTFDWTPGTPGSATIRVRGIDDSGNIETPGASVTVVVAPGDCPCTNLWKPTTVPPIPDAGDANAYELGVKFKSDIDGFITGVRFYKSVANNGTHTGTLWTTGGAPLATATFVSETPSGWQQVLFGAPVPIAAGTMYVASYHTNVGHYTATNDYFTSASVDSPPLHAPTSLIAGGNGLFISGASAFPTQTFRDTNYWVDVVFSPTTADTTPPTISNLRARTIDSAKVSISWTTDEPANSQVEYSTDFTFPQAQTLKVTSAAFVTTRTLLLTGLKSNTTYYYRVTSADAAGNSTTSPAPSFTVPGPTLRDTAQTDFLAGTGTGTYASETDDGELILAPAVGNEFSGTTMPPGWIEWAFGPNGYSALGGGELIVDGVRVAMCATDPTTGACLPGEAVGSTPSAIFTAPHTLEFVATFTGDAFQHAGFGQTLWLASEPWAIFSTMSGGALNARTNTGSNSIDTFLGSGLVGEPHLFRIDWKTSSVDYYIDGSLVASHPLTVTGPMRPIAASDFNEFGGNVTVNWMRMTPYAANGTFLSRVFDAGSPVDWNSIQWTAATPAGTSVAISVRTGNAPTPDGTWTAFAPITTPGPLTAHSQFIQYRAVLSSASTGITPRLDDIIISTGHAPVANPDSAIVATNGSHLFAASGPTSLIANDTDSDPGDVLHVDAITPPTHGSAVLAADGSVTYTPAVNYVGPDAFMYTVSDGLLTATAAVSIDVRSGNAPPVAANDFYSVNEDSTLTVPAAAGVLVNDTDAEHDPLTAAVTALPLHGLLTLSGNGAFAYTPAANYSGSDSFAYRANDGAADSNEATVTITVNPVNDAPSFSAGGNVTVLEDAGAQTVANWATNISAGPANESAQTLNFVVTSSNTALFSVQPAVAADGTLTFTPAPNGNGSATVSVQVHDNGGTANGGVDTSAAQTFTITVTAVNDAPSFTKGADESKLGVVGAQSVPNWATNLSAGPADEASQTLNFIVTNNNTALFTAQPAVAANGTLTYTPAANVAGSAVVSVSLHDNGGVANGGVDTSAAQTFSITIGKATTTTAVNSSLTTLIYGQAVTFTATAAVVAPGTGVPSGSVTFMDGAATLGSATLDGTGKTTFATSALKAGTHSITAIYAGGTLFTGSTSAAVTETVGTARVTITADNKTRPVGAANPPLTVTYLGLVNGDTPASLTTPPTVTTTATSASPAGTYPITATGAANSNYTFTYVNGTMTVIPIPTLTAFDSSANEGNTGTSPLTFAVTLSSAIDVPVTVDYATVNGSAVGGVDYLSASGTLVFAPRETTKSVAVAVIGNTTFQNDRSFTLKLANATNAAISGSVGKGTIVDDDPKPVISVSANSVVEGNTGTTPVTVTVTLTGATAVPASVDYMTVDGTATAGSDYIAASGTLTFAPGETVKTFVVSVLGDIVAEATETFTVRLTNTVASVGGVNVATVSIIDDDSTSWVNTSAADFRSGTPDAGAYLSQTNNGEVILAPALGSEFRGQTLDAGWTSTTLVAGGAATLGAGGITIDGASVVGGASGFNPGRSVEFSAKFSGAGQNAGFTAAGALSAPYAVFGTKVAGTLLARSVIAGTTLETPISPFQFNQTHKFRIDWNATTIVYWVDDKQVATHTITVSQAMRPTALDTTVGGGALFIEYMRMTPYAASGTYTSAVFDAGAAVTWMTMSWTSNLPVGTTVALTYRTGSTPTPDATWSALKSVSSSGATLSGSSRYLQFVVQEKTTDQSQTAVLKDVTLTFKR